MTHDAPVIPGRALFLREGKSRFINAVYTVNFRGTIIMQFREAKYVGKPTRAFRCPRRFEVETHLHP